MYIYTHLYIYMCIHIYAYIYPFYSQYIVMHCTHGMSNQWKWPLNNDEIWYEKVVQKIALSESIHSCRRTGVTGSFKFDENI